MIDGKYLRVSTAGLLISMGFLLPCIVSADDDEREAKSKRDSYERNAQSVQLGPRPFYLVNDMEEGALKSKLQSCNKGPFKKTDFSIGHRGAPLLFPEHTKESYVAAARMGAGILECDVTFTKDKELVCRHSQCDLHTTTNILATPLAAKCNIPPDYSSDAPFANVQCCTSDITLAEFKMLKGKMDAGNPNAATLQEYLNSTDNARTDLYAGEYAGGQNLYTGTLLSHAESIALFQSLGAKMTPELKSPSVFMPFNGFSQEDYAQKMIDEYKAAGVKPEHVWAQSFNYSDVLYWVNNEPQFGEQAVYLDGRYDDPAFNHTDPATWSPSMMELAADGVNIIAPPMWMLVAVDSANNIVPSTYAMMAKNAGLDIITWTLERSGLLRNGGGGWYYQTTNGVIDNEGDTMVMLDVLAQDVGILGIFSDWPATVTYYASCMKLK
ncbi:MAG: glycerophosphodiester phosphodiesterase [Gammaproteobacteria bacterium SG8_11]|nr:MAG: glycerophosphodiester phosphodiesterase [Gammaproteobacteria bacterium SG8_11]